MGVKGGGETKVENAVLRKRNGQEKRRGERIGQDGGKWGNKRKRQLRS